MTAQGYDMDQSLADKFSLLLDGNGTRRQHDQPARGAAGAPIRVYTEEQLQSMGMVELRNVLRDLGLNLGPQPKYLLVAAALSKQEELQQQHSTVYTEEELKELPFLELEEIAANLNIQDTSLCLHSEIIDLILATQISLSDAPPLPPLPPAPPAPEIQRIPSEKRSEGIKDCDLCCFAMGGNAVRKMAVPPCGHLYCYDCWMLVVNDKARCPACSKKVAASDIRKIYI
jgi:hypothetical protein